MTLLEGYTGAVGVSPWSVLWLILVAVLWIGFFFLEGFDFGAGMLVPFIGKSDQARRVIMNTVGPHWDGNEVWLLTAGGATFAAFSGWYATLFSGLYLPLFLVLVGLILRGVSFEYRSKRDSATWRAAWDWLCAVGSFIPALVFGVGFANFLIGLPVDSSSATTGTGNAFGGPAHSLYTGGFWHLFTPFALIGGLLFVAMFLTHGAYFIALKTTDVVHETAQALANKLALVAGVLLLIFVVWGNARWFMNDLPGQLGWLRAIGWIAGIVAVLAVFGGWFVNGMKRDGWAFIAQGAAILLMIVMIFAQLYPGLGFDNSVNAGSTYLDITTATNTDGTLKLMTIFAAIMVPIVLLYTIWTYWVFRRRLNVTNIPALAVTTAA